MLGAAGRCRVSAWGMALACGCRYEPNAHSVIGPSTRVVTCAACAQYDRERAEHRSKSPSRVLASATGEQTGGGLPPSPPPVAHERGEADLATVVLGVAAIAIVLLVVHILVAVVRVGLLW